MTKLYHLHYAQKFPVSQDEVWDFISNPENLALITPSEVGFEILNRHLVQKMYEGLVIHYRIRPLWGIPLSWVSVIPHFAPPGFFADEQKYGPYKFWHHQHFLHPIEGGVEMTDVIHYQMPMGFLGDWLHSFLVRKKLKRIFEFRKQKLEEKFGRFAAF